MPQPTLDEVMVALRNADKTGNTEDATKLAAIAKQLSDEQSAQEEAQKPSILEKTTEAAFGKGMGNQR